MSASGNVHFAIHIALSQVNDMIWNQPYPGDAINDAADGMVDVPVRDTIQYALEEELG